MRNEPDDKVTQAGVQRLTLTLESGPDTDDQELAQLTGQLRRHLLELDVKSVETVRSMEVPAGAKPGEVIALGMLAVQLVPQLLPAVITVLTEWWKDRPVRKIELTIGHDTLRLTRASRQDQERALQLFLSKHSS